MRKILIYISAALVLAALFFFFRPKNNIRHELVLAEEVMNDHPDSALHILEKVKSSALIGENRALFALLMTQAQFKCKQSPTSDSLLSIAYDYYVSRKDSLRKAQAYYYKGRIEDDLGNNPEAFKNYQKASVAVPTINYDFLALIYNRWGILFHKQHLYDHALLALKKSLVYCILDRDTLKQIYTLRDIGKSYAGNKKYAQALFYYKKALHLARLIDYKVQVSDISATIAFVYKCVAKYKMGLSYINQSISLSPGQKYICSRYMLKGNLLFLNQEYDSARYYLNLSKKKANNGISEATYYSLMYELENRLGNYREALTFSNLFAEYYAEYVKIERETTLAELQNKYDYSLMKNENNRLKIAEQRRDQVILLVGLITIIVFTLFIYTNLRRRSLKRAMKDELKKMEDGLVKQHLIYTQEKTIEMQRHQNEFLMQQKEMNVELSRKSDELKQQQEKERELKEQIFKMDAIVQKINAFNSMKPLQRSHSESQFTLSFGELSDLEEALNLCYDNFAERLRSQFPKLKDDDIHLCCLLKIKVPNKNILSLLDTNELALKKRRYRIKHDKMELEEDVSSLDEFLSNY